ncbi:MAG: hypothetical protein J0L72_00480 [Armatimonadetes bacterium]|nr:hypothetical protein [Armatimonadota bacterium]
MSYITEETKDVVLAQDMTVFLANANTYKTVLGLTTANLAALSSLCEDFQGAVTVVASKKAELSNVTADKNEKKAAARSVINSYAKTWRANAAIPNSVLDALLVPNHNNNGSSTAPTTPKGLTVTINTEGVVTLKWNRSGNIFGTIFIVESAPSATAEYTTLDVTTKAKVDFTPVVGQEIWLRVTAKRGNLSSAPSLPFSLWADGGTGEFSLAA